MYKNKSFDDFLSEFEVDIDREEETLREEFLDGLDLDYSTNISEDLNGSVEMNLISGTDTILANTEGTIAISNEPSWTDSTFTITSGSGSTALEVNPEGNVRIDGSLHLPSLNEGKSLKHIAKNDNMEEAIYKMNLMIDVINELIEGKSKAEKELEEVKAQSKRREEEYSDTITYFENKLREASKIPASRLGSDHDVLKDLIG